MYLCIFNFQNLYSVNVVVSLPSPLHRITYISKTKIIIIIIIHIRARYLLREIILRVCVCVGLLRCDVTLSLSTKYIYLRCVVSSHL